MGRGTGSGCASALRFEPVASHVCCVILVVLLVIVGLMGMGIAKVAMGVLYLSDCDKQSMIPIYLLASGGSTVLMIGLSQFKPRADEKRWKCTDRLNMFGILGLLGTAFYFGWLVYGCFLILGDFSDILDGCPGQTDCCDKDLIKFSVFTLVADLIVCAALIVGLVLLVVLVLLSKPPKHSRLEPAREVFNSY